MRAYVLINTHIGEIKQVIKELRKLEGIRTAEMTFGPFDIVAVVEQEDLARFGSLLANSIQPIPGVEKTLTCLAVEL